MQQALLLGFHAGIYHDFVDVMLWFVINIFMPTVSKAYHVDKLIVAGARRGRRLAPVCSFACSDLGFRFGCRFEC